MPWPIPSPSRSTRGTKPTSGTTNAPAPAAPRTRRDPQHRAPAPGSPAAEPAALGRQWGRGDNWWKMSPGGAQRPRARCPVPAAGFGCPGRAQGAEATCLCPVELAAPQPTPAGAMPVLCRALCRCFCSCNKSIKQKGLQIVTVVTSRCFCHREGRRKMFCPRLFSHVRVFIRFPCKEENSLEGLVETWGWPLSRETSVPAPQHTACVHSSPPRIPRPAGCLRAQEQRERTAWVLSTSQSWVTAVVLPPGSTQSTQPHPGAQQEPAAPGCPAGTFLQGFAPWAGPFPPGSPSGGKAQAGLLPGRQIPFG